MRRRLRLGVAAGGRAAPPSRRASTLLRTAHVHEYGGPLTLSARAPDERPAPLLAHEVEVEVRAASLNPVDVRAVSSEAYGRSVFEPLREARGLGALPAVVGRDCAGVVRRVGSGVWDLAPGDRVLGCVLPTHPFGTWADRAVLPASALVPWPERLSAEEGAALLFVACTAWSALFDFGGARPGHAVTVLGAGGGVGFAALQLLRARGFDSVVAVCGAGDAEACVREGGAAEALDYAAPGLYESAAGGSDVVLDASTPGAVPEEDALRLLRRGGTLVSLNGDALTTPDRMGAALGLPAAAAGLAARKASLLLGRGLHYAWGVALPRPSVLARLAELAASGELTPQVGRVFPFDEASAALQHGARGRARTVVSM